MKYSEAVVGNSSSGIIEAPALGCRVLDIGDRQKGRLCSARVLHTTTTLQSIEEGYRQICENQIPEDDQPFGNRAAGEGYGEKKSQRREGKIFGGSEIESELGERRGEKGQADDGDCSGDE